MNLLKYGIPPIHRSTFNWRISGKNTLATQCIPTEERLSIRESMRLFLAVDSMMSSTPTIDSRNSIASMGSFEELCRSTINNKKRNHLSPAQWEIEPETMTNIDVLDGTSCGSTMACFATIFLSKTQISDHGIRDVINGTNFNQFMNNPNILLHSIKSGFCVDAANKFCHSLTSAIGSSISRYVAQGNVEKFANRLFGSQQPQEFPLIMFCSMAWTFPTHDQRPDKYESVIEETAKNDIGDHVFTIIKHNNEHFQMIQGYVEQRYYCDDLEGEIHYPSLNLHQWRKGGCQYSSHEGFSRSSMVLFCDSLGRFVEGARFDSLEHKEMFGVAPRGNDHVHWPSFNFMELCDHHIEGCGERSLIESMHNTVMDNKSA